jgi:hypothetical protein
MPVLFVLVSTKATNGRTSGKMEPDPKKPWAPPQKGSRRLPGLRALRILVDLLE